MSSSPDPRTVTIGGKSFTFEDLDRFAAMLRPSWELDEAPFASAPPRAAEELAALGGNGQAIHPALAEGAANGASAGAIAGIDVTPLGAAPASPPPAPFPQAISARPPPPPVSSRPVQAVAAPVSAPARPIRQLSDADISDELPAVRPSRKGLWMTVGLVALALVGFFGYRAMSGADEPGANAGNPGAATTAATGNTTTASPPARTDIPAPPPATAAATATTGAAAAAGTTEPAGTAPPATTAAPTPPPPPPPAATVAPAPPPLPLARVSAPTTSHGGGSARTSATPLRPTSPTRTSSASTPRSTSKSGGSGGIVRDNPF